MKPYNLTRFLFVVLFFSTISKLSFSATCVSTGNGNWHNAGTWSCGAVPGCGDSIVIKAGHSVTITAQADYSGCAVTPKVAIYGKLFFDNGNKLRLPCNGVIYIFAGASINPGTGGGNSNFIEICGDVYWNAAAGVYYGSGCMPPTAPGCAAVLPIELTDFSAQLNKNKVDIIWITAMEKNNSHFDVQRSNDASSFEKIGQHKSAGVNGNSNKVLQYVYEDNEPVNGVSYYRLKQVNLDQSYSYSKVVSVNYIQEKNIRFVIYPNPNNGEFTADISGMENNHEIKISLNSEKGELVYESSFYINDPSNSKLKIVPQHKLSSGLYICTLTLEGIQYKVKVIVS